MAQRSSDVAAKSSRRKPTRALDARIGVLPEPLVDSIPALRALIDAGTLSSLQAAVALRVAARSTSDLRDVLRARHSGITFPASLAHRFVDLVESPVDPDAVRALPEALALRHRVLPIGFEENGALVVATADATNVIAHDDSVTASGRDVTFVLAEGRAIDEAWARLRALDRSAEEMLTEAGSADDVDDDDELVFDPAADVPLVRAINHLIKQAVHQHASDLHIEPQERDIRVRIRLDGVLHTIMRVPKSVNCEITSRLKVMANMDIAERRVPQDGRMTVTVDRHPVDLRVATVPSVWGEDVILRILDRSSGILSLADLGFTPETLVAYEDAISDPVGAILVVGPTGSGKSTTLYSTLSALNEESRKIISVEDPVEVHVPGVSQIHVNRRAGLSFASALRSIVRSDPDVVMVGEIRDAETAKIAIDAAMTGHLVLSTLHTNDAPSALTRLIEMGVEPFLVASSLRCVVAQRLARKLCVRCREVYDPPAHVLADVEATGERFYRAVGCPECCGTGYRGRVALVELMIVTEEIERLAADRRSSEELRRTALAQGMRSLRDDGLRKVRDGITSLDEVLRVVGGRTRSSVGDVRSIRPYAVE
jgi:type IV pilus assembly protein PilB